MVETVSFVDPRIAQALMQGVSAPAALAPRPGDRRRQALVEAMMSQGMSSAPVASPLEGVARMGQALVGAYMARQADEGDRRRQDDYSRTLADALMGGRAPAAGGGAPNAAPPVLTSEPAAAPAAGAPLPLAPAPEEPRINPTPQMPDAGGRAPRGVRNNNPGNLVFMERDPFQGQTGSDGRFGIYDTPESGIRALALNLNSAVRRHGADTPLELAERWAPAAEPGNNPAAYARTLAGGAGIGADDRIDLGNPRVRRGLVEAIMRQENGTVPYDAATIDRALAAADGRGAGVQVASAAPPTMTDAAPPSAPSVAVTRSATAPATPPAGAPASGPAPVPGSNLDRMVKVLMGNPDTAPLAMQVALAGMTRAEPRYMAAGNNIVAIGPQGVSEVYRGQPELTTAQRNAAAVAQPGTPEYTQALRDFGRAGTAVTVNSQGETSFAKERGQRDAQRLNEMVQGGDQAVGLLQNLDRLETAMRAYPTGAGGDTRLLIQQIADRFGIETQGLPEAEMIQSIQSSLAPALRPPGSGASSDRDVNLFLQSLPNLVRTPEGNTRLIDFMRRLANRRIEVARMAEQWADRHNGMSGFTEQVARLPPVFSDAERRVLSGGQRGEPMAEMPDGRGIWVEDGRWVYEDGSPVQ